MEEHVLKKNSTNIDSAECPCFVERKRTKVVQPRNQLVAASSGCLEETLSHKNVEKREDEWFSMDLLKGKEYWKCRLLSLYIFYS